MVEFEFNNLSDELYKKQTRLKYIIELEKRKSLNKKSNLIHPYWSLNRNHKSDQSFFQNTLFLLFIYHRIRF